MKRVKGCYKLIKTRLENIKKGDLFIQMEGKNMLDKDISTCPNRFVFKATGNGKLTSDARSVAVVECDSVDIK